VTQQPTDTRPFVAVACVAVGAEDRGHQPQPCSQTPAVIKEPADAQRTILAITTVVVAQILFAVVGLAKLYEPSTEVLIGIQLVLAIGLSTVSTVAWMVR